LPTVAYTSGSECSVSASAYFRVSFSVFFRVIPWLILLLRQPSLTLPTLKFIF